MNNSILNYWHSLLQMPKRDADWHAQDMVDELAEYYEEEHFFMKWSELSDVVYTCTRGRWSGHDISFPFSLPLFAIGVLYMIPKYTSRWFFFRCAGKKMGAREPVRQVRNPKKTHKLHKIAKKYRLDEKEFQAVCEKQLRYWPLLP